MKVAVVILNWNGKKLLQQFLPSIIQYSENASIYVADNASTDDSITFVKENFPTIKIIQNSKNHGFAKGYNEALQIVEEPIYALVNSDIEVTKNWLVPVLSLFESEKKVAIVQPKILDYKEKSYFEYAGAAGGFIDQYGYPFCRGRIFETLEKDNQQYDNETSIFWATGACFFIRKEVFHLLNGFDADFFAHQEEIDLCWRAQNLGYSIKYTPQSTVYHVGGATLDTANPQKTFLNFRNSLFMLVKNLPSQKLFSILFKRMILDGIAAFSFLFQGKFNHFWAVARAHFAFYGNFSKFYAKRGTTQTKNYHYTKSIVWSYFVNDRKTFTEIF